VGTFAVTSLMVFSAINRIEAEFPQKFTTPLTNSSIIGQHSDSSSSAVIELSNDAFHLIEESKHMYKLQIATSLAFWCGIFQVLFICRPNKRAKHVDFPCQDWWCFIYLFIYSYGPDCILVSKIWTHFKVSAPVLASWVCWYSRWRKAHLFYQSC
jgi:hypothetical protein